MKRLNADNLPLVSVVIPCRNEVKFIRACLDSVLVQTYPLDKLEVLVADGMSDDGTRQIVEDFENKYPFVKLLDNKEKITPSAFNVGVKHAHGEVIIIMGAHADYEKNYISECVKYLYEYEADNVGGVIVSKPRGKTFLGKAMVLSLSSKFGVGNSDFRTGSKTVKWVDTVFGGCYKKEVFDRIGLFNEKLVSSQDIEFNKRLMNAGGKILLVPHIICKYYARSDLRSFLKNNFRNGMWITIPFAYTDVMLVSWRHFTPLVFVATLLGSLFLGLIFKDLLWIYLVILFAYLTAALIASIRIAYNNRSVRYLFVMPMIFASLHVAYGIGSLVGVLKLIFSKSFWDRFLLRRLLRYFPNKKKWGNKNA